MIAGVTLSITATNAGAVPLPCANPDTSHTNTIIGMFVIDGFSSSGTYGEYLTIGEVSELDFRNECKNYTNFRKVFRENVKTKHDLCSGIGEECEYSGSAGCGTRDGANSGSAINNNGPFYFFYLCWLWNRFRSCWKRVTLCNSRFSSFYFFQKRIGIIAN